MDAYIVDDVVLWDHLPDWHGSWGWCLLPKQMT
jgi:hypothetical protein